MKIGCVFIRREKMTPYKLRDYQQEASDRAVAFFKDSRIRVVVNVGVLTTGFDYPELDTIIMARPTKSLSLWYQIVGRAIRPSPKKDKGWIVDLCGSLKRFGKVEDLRLVETKPNLWQVQSKGRQLTNIILQ